MEEEDKEVVLGTPPDSHRRGDSRILDVALYLKYNDIVALDARMPGSQELEGEDMEVVLGTPPDSHRRSDSRILDVALYVKYNDIVASGGKGGGGQAR